METEQASPERNIVREAQRLRASTTLVLPAREATFDFELLPRLIV